MLNASRVMRDERQLKAVTGVSSKEFGIILPAFEKALYESFKSRRRERAVGAGRKGILASAADKLIFILLYVKVYPTCDVSSFIFGAHRTRCCEWARVLLPLLEKALGRTTVLPKRQITSVDEFLALFPEVKDLFIDGTERPVRRSQKYHKQSKNYSGKKKRHTRKNIVACDEKGRVLLISPTDGGRCHDLRCFKKWGIGSHIPKAVGLWTDKGFAGLKSTCDNKVMMPHKKPPKGKLSEAQREENKIISGLRIISEHAIGGIKRFGCLSDVYRNRRGQDDRMMSVAGGIWNLHLQNRAPC